MNHVRLPLMFVFLFLFNPASARSDDLNHIAGGGPIADRQAILETLQTYLTVTDDKNALAIPKSFHPTAYLTSVSAKGALRSLSQDFWWERVSQIPDDTPPRTSTVLIIDVSGHAAIARIDIKNGVSGETTTDYFNMQKVAAGWRIVNKTLSEPI